MSNSAEHQKQMMLSGFFSGKIKTVFLITIIAILFISRALSQAPGIEWQNTIGGNDQDELSSIQQTADGGYILDGWSSSDISSDKTEASMGYNDYWVVKLNSIGGVEWENTIGGNSLEYVAPIQQTSDGGYILGGSSISDASGDKTEDAVGSLDYWIVKLNSAGSIEWENTIGGTSEDYLYCLQQTSDGGYIVGGASISDISGDKTENSLGAFDYWVVKLSSAGIIQWQNTIGGLSEDYMQSIQQTSEGGFILGGYSYSGISGDKTEASLGGSDYWVVKLNSTGIIQWQNTIGGSNDDYLSSIQKTDDYGYILGGLSNSGISGDKTEASAGADDYWVVKLLSDGAIEWQNTIGGSDEDRLLAVQPTADGGFILGGQSNSGISGDKIEASLGGNDYWVIKLNSAGTIIWQNTIGGSNDDELHSIQQTADGGYVLGGSSNSGVSGDKTEASSGIKNYWVMKLYPDGCKAAIELDALDLTVCCTKLTWKAVTGAAKYKVRYKVNNTNVWTKKTVFSNALQLSGLAAGTKYVWQVQTICSTKPNVSSDWSAKKKFTTPGQRMGEEVTEATLEVYPNPVTSSATISFSIKKPSNVTIELFDLAGRKLQTLLDENMETGSHGVVLNRRRLADGMYMIIVTTPALMVTQSIIIQ